MRFNFEPTAVGSVPFKDPKAACRLILELFREIPFWPQLPKRSFLENMYIQYSERLPGLVLDQKNKTIHIDTARVASEIEEVYQKYIEGDVEYFRLSEEYANGFYEFLDSMKSPPKDTKYVKGHITGPISYGLTLTDEKKRSIIYDKDLFEVLTKTLSMKVKWQIRRLKKLFPAVIIFIDEPYLVSIGSSYVNIDAKSAFDRLGEIIKVIKDEGALSGLHCCGNTDWPLLLKSGVDILNFDSYNFSKEFSLYAQDIENFLRAGSAVAWGVVPSNDMIDKESVKALSEKSESSLKLLTDKGAGLDGISSLVTPSCGVGSLDDERARKALELTVKLSEKLRR